MGFNFYQKVVFSIDDMDVTIWMIISLALFILLLLLILILSIKYHKKNKKKYTEIEESEEPEEVIQIISKDEILHDTPIKEEEPALIEESPLEQETEEENEMATKKEEKKVTQKAAKKEPKTEATKKVPSTTKETPKKGAPKKAETKKAAPKKTEPKKEKKEEKASTLEADLEHMRESASASYRSKVYHISLRDDGKWQVKFAKGEKVIKTFSTQMEAIEYAKKLAENQDGSIAIHKKDGKIRKLKY